MLCDNCQRELKRPNPVPVVVRGKEYAAVSAARIGGKQIEHEPQTRRTRYLRVVPVVIAVPVK